MQVSDKKIFLPPYCFQSILLISTELIRIWIEKFREQILKTNNTGYEPAVVAEWSKAQQNVQSQCELNDPGLNPAWGIYVVQWLLFIYNSLQWTRYICNHFLH